MPAQTLATCFPLGPIRFQINWANRSPKECFQDKVALAPAARCCLPAWPGVSPDLMLQAFGKHYKIHLMCQTICYHETCRARQRLAESREKVKLERDSKPPSGLVMHGPFCNGGFGNYSATTGILQTLCNDNFNLMHAILWQKPFKTLLAFTPDAPKWRIVIDQAKHFGRFFARVLTTAAWYLSPITPINI